MMDLPSAGIAALHDPLVVTLCVFSLLGLAVHILFRRYPLGRALVRVVFLIVLTVVLLRAGIVPYQPLVLTGAPLEDAAHAALKIAWWAWAAWFVVGVLRVFVASERRPHEGKLVQDLLAGLPHGVGEVGPRLPADHVGLVGFAGDARAARALGPPVQAHAVLLVTVGGYVKPRRVEVEAAADLLQIEAVVLGAVGVRAVALA